MTSNSSGSPTSTRLGTQSQPRPSSSSMLWAHLQRKDTTKPANSTIPLPPLAPLDKTSTSLRILLHDTQSHFETFADKVNLLTKGVDEAKREIGLTKTLFEKEHEVLSNEMFSLVNRCQTEILKVVGEPAQASRLADLQGAVQLRLEGLDKRVDSMQMVLYQSNAQTLQAQTQALQTIQEQQCNILAALTPLLPLLQAVPLHIETARNTVQETISKGFETAAAAAAKPIPSPPKTRTRSTSPAKPHSTLQEKSPSSARKRRRIDENSTNTLQQRPSPPSPPNPPLPLPLSILRRRSLQKARSISNAPPAPVVRPPFTNLDPKTPRRPLADLHLSGNNSLIQARKMSLNSRRGSSVFAPTPNPSRIPQLPPRTANSVAPAALASTFQVLSTPPLVQHVETPRPNEGSNFRVPQAAPSTAIVHRTQGSAVHHRTSTILPRDDALGPSKLFSMAPPSLRQRRSPFRQGRRFIPLDDSDDSEVEAKEG